MKQKNRDSLRDLLGTEREGEGDDHSDLSTLEDELTQLDLLIPDLETEDSAAWQLQLNAAGLHSE